MFTRQQTMNNYGLPPTYQSRMQPDYFADVLPDSELWQADVYRLAAWLARKAGVRRIVDIGCGRAEKLMRLASEFETLGIDYQENIEWCKQQYPDKQWFAANLETADLQEYFVYINFHGVVICADVIEHIVNPCQLLDDLRGALNYAPYVLISTPDRDRLNQGTPNGMPDNPAHVREWTRQEFTDWLTSEGLPVVWSGWTVSFDKQRDKRNTILVILSSNEMIDDIPTAFEEYVTRA